MNKQFAVRLLSLGGAYRLGEILSSHKLVVLTYHRVIPRDECPGGRRPPNTHFAEEFDRQMEFVAERFHVPAGNELRDFLQGNGRLPRYSLAVTFDDGYENNFTFAHPILQRHGLHAIFFATSNLIGQPGRPFWFDRLDQILSAVPRTDFLKRLARLEPSMFASSEMPVHRCFKALSNTRQSKLLDSLELEFWGKDIPESCRAVHGLMSVGCTKASLSRIQPGYRIAASNRANLLLLRCQPANEALRLNGSLDKLPPFRNARH